MNDKDLISLCKRLASRFIRQAAHLGAPEDVFDELVNVAYVAGREGRCILWDLISYVTLPSNTIKKRIGGASQRAFRTGDERRIRRDRERAPEEIAEREDDERRAFELIRMLSPDDLVLICLYFGREKNYKEIGEIFERSGWWVSQKIRCILDGLRKEMGG